MLGTLVSELLAPSLFGALIETDRPGAIAAGYLIGAGLMLLAGVAEYFLGVASERKSLEDVALPLSEHE